ncbi:MAG: phosphate transport system regulatory protein PhoU [Candidatus Coatesbacteria bacterium 4484_99]|uniref:Phosphate-specific transport system accessory protein PhoU n=1 Tax=Candidatus Coatesbacteria bacterium 4484_99 TaxID=1970774 RepID=A0A1W9S0R4_9BACT|nr:MAG: phosphate transport system regulatory protein PhoU [Candidatus Coatesbacteria bacterium 4484_99]RLC39987.1 MAG: phosphate transport system regulatory protein PhoU [Candidatus Coatesbacteria bacterium]RLC42896.1 MAG: phosphate transport system regulatory protein PhoU [Candidatus Coatesbacteria bacterium]RLC44666.1 MAG: phosphate transport system regulatory protein PhoU [Candidatus Coatesbacteria bacterium]
MLSNRLRALNEKITEMASYAKLMVERAITAYRNRDAELAKKIEYEDEVVINRMEVENLEEAVKIIALYQPTATDLRMLIASILINRDLERIGDHAQNIAGYVMKLARLPKQDVVNEIPQMADYAIDMLNKSLESLFNGDEDLARRVITSDNVINEQTRNFVIKTIKQISKDQKFGDYGIWLALIARNLERIADHATNIAESVLFVLESKLYLHRKHDISKEIDGRNI